MAISPVPQLNEFDIHSDVQLNGKSSPVLKLNVNLVSIGAFVRTMR